ncbi:MAG: DNA mismatch repair endonuclease MutL [Hyphomonadaceae bacterium]|nr:DNA mismatch repair endonuclease MutL [Clostridia bacterium]
MKPICLLDMKIANMIAAGEVVERPASVIKELIENSLDAGATHITVEIKNGGISLMRVTDDGCGIPPIEASLAFERHATSKIATASDLEQIASLGFRGEALSSIAAVSHVELFTKTADSECGAHVILEGGKTLKNEGVGCPNGTTIVVKNLFYNTPARMKFLKKDATEAGVVADVVGKLMLGNPHVSFRFLNNGKEMYFSNGDGALLNGLVNVWGSAFRHAMLPIDSKQDGIHVTGLTGKTDAARANRTFQNIYINGRIVRSRTISMAVEEAYRNMLTVGRFPAFVLQLAINPMLVDVNVHPTKMEVKFSEERKVYQAVFWAIKSAMQIVQVIPEMTVKRPTFLQAVAEGTWVQQAFKQSYQAPAPQVAPKPTINYAVQEVQAHYEVPPQPPLQYIVEEVIQPIKDVVQETQTPYGPTVEILDETQAPPYRIVGQVFETYVIIERAGEMLLIDQHAGHERLIYEKLVKSYQTRAIVSQLMLVPVVVDLSAEEFGVVQDNLQVFSQMGFELEEFGNHSIIVRQTPIPLQEEALKTLVCELVSAFMANSQALTTQTELAMLYTIACKAAVKANRQLHGTEMAQLVQDLFAMPNINTCPHGRPIMLSLTKYQIEKEFKRVM